MPTMSCGVCVGIITYSHGSIMISQIQLCLPFDSIQETNQEPAVQLRDYQSKVIQDTYTLLRRGTKRILVYSPTGSGKTVIASQMMHDATKKGRRSLFLVHRDFLLQQTQATLEKFGIEAGIIKSGFKENRALPVQIASLQSLAQREFPESIDVLFADECHTTCWHQTYERLKQQYPDSIQIGLSASPWRVKKKEYFGQHFDAIVSAPSIRELVAMRYLAQPRYYSWGGLLDLSELDDGKNGDFHEKQLQAICLHSAYNEKIVSEFQDICPEKTAITFSAGIEQSKLLCKFFNTSGITAEHLDATTPYLERMAMFNRAKEGKTRVLCSVTALIEGFDLAEIGCVILARPTRSKALLFQMAGRGLRPYKSKVDCLLLDFGSNFLRHGFLTAHHPVQLEPIERKTRPTTKECPACHQVISIFALICPHCGHEFAIPSEDEEVLDDTTDKDFGEIFDIDEKQKILFLRNQIRYLYKGNHNPDRIWAIFSERWGHQPPNAWHKGAVFGNKNTETNRQKFLDYLHRVCPNAKNEFWYQFHVELEFGKRETWKKQETKQHKQQSRNSARTYQQHRQYEQQYSQHKQQQYKQTVADDFKRLMWWEILELQPPVNKLQLKSAYKRLALVYHPDCSQLPESEATEKMKLLNWAYSEGLKYA